MLTTILAVAVLFGVFAFVKPRAGCGGNCGLCTKSCSSESHHD
jgi:heterodisulfide reductase subunit C